MASGCLQAGFGQIEAQVIGRDGGRGDLHLQTMG